MDVSQYNVMLPINISNVIKERGMKNNAVAKMAGYSVQQFSAMLNGRKIIKPCDILAISDALGVNVGDLFIDASQSSA
ncbi:helix-turn-helix transcriptional regulator [Oscillospiraceae bacterium 44-5]|jgi:transcriptional regulator with XRE-family HTH domain|uniref:helix-turn-helix domain-containing protein n=1 Tax=Lawsonibacter sp. JLR.KK007 TaxID=3114293 RepID=UPI0021721C5D|nr:helix-turn-helix transcriptional regulator [Lawsonibacter sp.]